MGYKLKYDSDSIVLSIFVKKGKLSHAEEAGDVVLHVDSKGNSLYLELINASKIVPMMVQAMPKWRDNSAVAVFVALRFGCKREYSHEVSTMRSSFL